MVHKRNNTPFFNPAQILVSLKLSAMFISDVMLMSGCNRWLSAILRRVGRLILDETKALTLEMRQEVCTFKGKRRLFITQRHVVNTVLTVHLEHFTSVLILSPGVLLFFQFSGNIALVSTGCGVAFNCEMKVNQSSELL